jgi:hypothetical protein
MKVRGSQAPRQTVRRPSSALSNLGRRACPAIPGMERKVTSPFIDNLMQAARPGSHSHAPNPAEIQRWEDDGGAIFPDTSRASRVKDRPVTSLAFLHVTPTTASARSESPYHGKIRHGNATVTTEVPNGRSHGHVRGQVSGLGIHGQFSGGYFESKV